MSVIINGFNMPDTCEKCLFARWSNVYQTSSCVLVPRGKMCFEMYSVEYRSKRSDICPLTTIHPEPPKMGKWIAENDEIISGRCSVCGWEAILYETDVFGMDYCPNCGARLEVEDETVG